ncbi:MAG: very short patch repair endonuclease [Candidatus Methanoplasma sp.]|jgi:DNA mismatch endonuclease (patch repair protein)|nr:very short patch repair endonuclease [Candidatus Methanoplasma sp.]
MGGEADAEAGGRRVPKAPPASSEAVARSMKSNKSKGTKPELMLRKALRDAGHPGYRVNWKKAPGKPDICYPGRRLAIFVNGCFWHRCPLCNPSSPKTHGDYWEAKFESNVERDRLKGEELLESGWSVVVAWECEVRKDMDGVLGRISPYLARGPPRERDGGGQG